MIFWDCHTPGNSDTRKIIDTSNKSWNNIPLTDEITLKYSFGKIGETEIP